MIPANELRIGNWVGLKNSDPVKVDVDNIVDIVNNTAIFEPIPLTTEILEKCDVQLKHCGDFTIAGLYFTNDSRINAPYEMRLYNEIKDGVFFTFYKRIFYLHELQNILFWWMGEELKVDL